MSFAVEDFHDLVQLLEEHPEWRGELRRLVLSDELLAVPDVLKSLVEAQSRTEVRLESLVSRVEELVEAQGRTEVRLESLVSRVEELAEAQGRTEAWLGELAQAQTLTESLLRSLTYKVDQLVRVVSKLTGDQPGIKGFIVETRYEKKAHAYFAPIARRLRVLTRPDLDGLLDAAEESGDLTEAQADEIRLADIVARGKRRDDDSEVLLVVEAAWVVDKGDVDRARDRAKLLAKIGVPTIPVVAGEEIDELAKQIAQDSAVWQVTNGSVVPPKTANAA